MAWACGSCGGDNPDGMRFCGHCGTKAEDSRPPGDEARVTEALRSFVSRQVADRLVESGGQMLEERRLVTAVFADISGFTALADRHDPEELVEMINPIVSRLSEIVGRYEGYVSKYAGDALLAFFGAPVAHEDDAERALMVALEMHRELDHMIEELPAAAHELVLHVGVNSGHVVAGVFGSEVRLDYSVLGDAVNVAQRLESSAPSGETYVGEVTYLLTRERFEFEPVGPLTVKNKPEPITAWRLIGRRAPATPDRRPSAPLVGRAAFVAATDDVLEALGSGIGARIAVTGDAGVGKSRLSEEIWRRARSRGVQWLEGRCVSYGSSVPYWPYTDLLHRFIGLPVQQDHQQTAALLAQVMSDVGMEEAVPYFGRLLGIPTPLAHAETPTQPEEFRHGLFRAFASWIQRMAANDPVVIAIEDIHWLDASSMALTAHLAAVARRAPVCFYLTTRPEGGEHLGVIDEAGGGISHLDIALEPLLPEETTYLVEQMLGGEAPAALIDAVLERAGGNPFFVQETVRALLDQAALQRDELGWQLRPGWNAQGVPATVEGVLSSRIDLLPRSTTGVLQVAAVIGRRINLPLLEAVAEVDDLDLEIERLLAGGFFDRSLIDNQEVLVFHHTLVLDVTYSRLLKRQRRDLHREVGEAAETIYGSGDDVIDRLAHHLYLGEAGAKAIEALLRAGDRARRLYANEEAILHLERAAELLRVEPHESEQLPTVLLDLADLHELIGHYDDALRIYAEVRNMTGEMRAWVGMASTLRKRGDYDAALSLLDEALLRADLPHERLAPLWLQKGRTLSVIGDFEAATVALRNGLDSAHEPLDPVAAHLLLQLSRAEALEGRFAEALDDGLRAVSIFEREDDVRGLATAQRNLGAVYRELGNLDDAAFSLQRGLALAERVGNVEEIGGCLINLGLVELSRGNVDVAIACDRRAIEAFERSGNEPGRAIGYANLAEKLMHGDEYEEALGHCERSLLLARSIGNLLVVADASRTEAAILFRLGQYARAARRAQEAGVIFHQSGAVPDAVSALELGADAWEKAGESERARELIALARSLTPVSR